MVRFDSSVYSVRFVCLLAAMVLYALMGSPTPDAPSVIEAVIGALLCVAAFSGVVRIFSNVAGLHVLWRGAGMVLLLYGLSVPMLFGVINWHSLSLIFRDVLPFLFLCLPLFVTDIFDGSHARSRLRVFILAAVGLGIAMAGRSLLRLFDFGSAGELYYLANSPLVLLSALTCIAYVFERLSSRDWLHGLPKVAVVAMFACVPMVAMALTMQRASLGYIAVVIGVLIWRVFKSRPYRIVPLLCMVALTIQFFSVEIVATTDALLSKTSEHGFNMRAEEWRAVLVEAQSSITALLFGQGWGTSFNSPAVGGVRVNFTHSFFSSMLLKTGVVGMALAGLYMLGMLRLLWRMRSVNFILALAIAGPFAIDMTLYATFKSLDFGLLLLLISAGVSLKSR